MYTNNVNVRLHPLPFLAPIARIQHLINSAVSIFFKKDHFKFSDVQILIFLDCVSFPY